MKTTKKYANPPLVEAICEFSFVEEKIPFEQIEENFTESVKGMLPVKKERKSVNFIINGKNDQLTSELKEKRGLIQFISSEGNTMAQIGEKLLAVNHLKPYKSWEKFQPVILENLFKYCTAANQEKIARISFRCINKIDIPTDKLQLGDYFNYSISTPKGISQNLLNLFLQSEHTYDEKHLLSITLNSTLPEKEGISSFFFDISYNHLEEITVKEADIVAILSTAHQRLNDVFEHSLTTKCKQLFEI